MATGPLKLVVAHVCMGCLFFARLSLMDSSCPGLASWTWMRSWAWQLGATASPKPRGGAVTSTKTTTTTTFRLRPELSQLSLGVRVPADSTNTSAGLCVERLHLQPTRFELERDHPGLTVVYGATMLGYKKEFILIWRQLQSLWAAGLIGASDVDVDVQLVFSHGVARMGPESDEHGKIVKANPLSKKTFEQRIKKIKHNFSLWSGGKMPNITIFRENLWEWPALHVLWEQAVKQPERLYLYFHSKGLTRQKAIGTGRTLNEMALFREVVAPWRSVEALFELGGEKIQHIGGASSEFGYQWFNFWWARGSFLAWRAEPPLTPRRDYYEEWLGRDDASGVNSSKCPLSVALGSSPPECSLGCNHGFNLGKCKRNRCVDSGKAGKWLQEVRKKTRKLLR